MELSADRTFRYRPLWYWWLYLLGVGLFCLVVIALVGSVLAYSARLAHDMGEVPPQLSRVMVMGWVVVGLGAILGGLHLLWWVQWVMLRRRGSVETTGAGVTVCNWRGKPDRLFWEDVSELQVRATVGFLRSGWVRFDLLGESKRIFVNYGIEEPDELLSRILAHTDLPHAETCRWGTRHYR